MINNLQLDVKKEDYNALSKKLNISLEESSGIKYIEAEQIFREDKDEKKHNTPKFQIDLIVRDNTLITIVQNGLISYFNNNEYIKTYQKIYNETNNDIINSIDEEIKELKSLRNTQNSTIDFSKYFILSSRDEMDIQNQIVDLKHKKSIIITNNVMLKPITFVEDFSYNN